MFGERFSVFFIFFGQSVICLLQWRLMEHRYFQISCRSLHRIVSFFFYCWLLQIFGNGFIFLFFLFPLSAVASGYSILFHSRSFQYFAKFFCFSFLSNQCADFNRITISYQFLSYLWCNIPELNPQKLLRCSQWFIKMYFVILFRLKVFPISKPICPRRICLVLSNFITRVLMIRERSESKSDEDSSFLQCIGTFLRIERSRTSGISLLSAGQYVGLPEKPLGEWTYYILEYMKCFVLLKTM